MNILFYQTSLSFPYILKAYDLISKKNKVNSGFIFRLRKTKSKTDHLNLTNLKKKKIKNLFFLNEFTYKKKIDLKYLSYFEDKISKQNIWKMISADRQYGRNFIHDIEGYKTKLSSNKDIILSNFNIIAKKVHGIINKFKPDVIFIPNGLSGLDVTIIEAFAKNYRIKILTPEPYRLKNYFFYCKNLFSKNLDIKKNYLIAKTNYKKVNKIDLIYNELTSKKENVSVDADEALKTIKKLNKKNFLQKISGNFIYTNLKHLYFFLCFQAGIKKNHLKYLTEYNLVESINLELKTRKYSDYLLSLNLIKKKEKYIYYPLHLNPETSTLLKGNDYMNQEYLVNAISKSIPSYCKLYVKEHPAMLASHPRKISFFKNIRKLPNVRLLNPTERSRKIISNAEAVVIVDGSSGLEALLSRVPLITLKQFNYDFLNLSITNNNIEDLFLDITKAIKKNKKVTQRQFEFKIKCLIKSIIDNSYSLRDPDTFYYFTKNPSEKDLAICAQDLANSLIKELKLKTS